MSAWRPSSIAIARRLPSGEKRGKPQTSGAARSGVVAPL